MKPHPTVRRIGVSRLDKHQLRARIRSLEVAIATLERPRRYQPGLSHRDNLRYVKGHAIITSNKSMMKIYQKDLHTSRRCYVRLMDDSSGD
jgi:hypothetical protein